MAYSDHQWGLVRACYERGLSLSEIIRRPEIEIKSKSQISKRASAENWQKETEKKHLVFSEVAAKAELAKIKKQKETMPTHERRIHDDIVDQRYRLLGLSVSTQEKALRIANDILSKRERAVAKNEEDGAVELDAYASLLDLADTTSKIAARGSVLAEPKQAQVSVNQQFNNADKPSAVILLPPQSEEWNKDE